MKFSEEILEKTFTEMLEKEGFPQHLGITIGRKPEIKELNDCIEVTIFAYKQAEISEKTSEKLRNSFDQIGGQVGGQVGDVNGLVERLVEGLVESQQMIVRLVEKNPEITIKELSEQIGISTTAIDKNIVTLKEKRIIRRVGGNKHGRWEIILDN